MTDTTKTQKPCRPFTPSDWDYFGGAEGWPSASRGMPSPSEIAQRQPLIWFDAAGETCLVADCRGLHLTLGESHDGAELYLPADLPTQRLARVLLDGVVADVDWDSLDWDDLHALGFRSVS